MPEIENEDPVRLRKKRPERALYVPPAQRKSSIKDNVISKVKPEHVEKKNKVREKNNFENEAKKKTARNGLFDTTTDCCSGEVNKFSALLDYFMCSYFFKARCECELYGDRTLKFNPDRKLRLCLKFREILGDRFMKLLHYFIAEINVIQFYSSPLVLDSSENIFLWKTTLKQNSYGSKENFFPLYNIRKFFQYSSDTVDARVPFFRNTHLKILDNFKIFSEYEGCSIENTFIFEKSLQHIYRHHLLWETIIKENYERQLLKQKPTTDKSEQVKTPNSTILRQEQKFKSINKDIKIISSHDPPQNPSVSKKDERSKIGGHEEELEIMRKTKENINRKIRPIIKYIPDTNDFLNIEDIKNWEDLLNDEGEIKEEYLAKDEKKERFTVNTENYDEFKEVEELEHMVELYDFPSSFKTNDLIQAFNNIDSDAMYIKWVDDTHAILVLGTLTQATKAINLNNPLIKVRPMSLASKTTLSVAYKNDLKPAMKRPQTNLQTARRFITAHLGTKIGVSKEKMAKERDDLKAAREMKKMARQNEKDAWEGNLKSTIH